MGDFSINLLNVDKRVPSSKFLECMYIMSCIPLISNELTTSATLIDDIFTNNITIDSTETCSGILYSDLSDNFPVFSYIDNNRCLTHVNPTYITKRLYTNQYIARFTSLFNADWSKVSYELDNQNNAYAAFYSEFGKHNSNYFHEVMVKLKYSNRKPWLSDGLKTSIKIINKLFVYYKKSPTLTNETNCNVYSNKLNSVVRIAERNHYQHLLRQNHSNLFKSLQLIKQIIYKNHRRCPTTEDDLIIS